MTPESRDNEAEGDGRCCVATQYTHFRKRSRHSTVEQLLGAMISMHPLPYERKLGG